MLQAISKLIEHIHTDDEIKEAAMSKLEQFNGGGVCTVISNSDKVGLKRVSVYLSTGTCVYCNDLPESQAVEHHRNLIDLVMRYRASDGRHFVTLK